jgi:hypothetical protein
VPVQAPDQPVNVELEAGVAVRVTAVPLGKLAVQVEPQLMPEGLLVTVPDPAPASLTVSWTGGTAEVLKVAVTAASAVSVTLHAPVPVQAPDHPAKEEPGLAVAVRVTAAPASKVALQVLPQLMPAGLLATTPLPLPAVCTASWKLVAILPTYDPQPHKIQINTRLQ